MTFTDWLAIYAAILATLGFGLSLFLGVRELRKEKRDLKVYFEHNVWEPSAYLKIVNIGHRPVTIKRIVTTHRVKTEERYFDMIPASFCFTSDLQKLPVILEDGEEISLETSELASEWIKSLTDYLQLTVFDAEENPYHVGETVVHHERP